MENPWLTESQVSVTAFRMENTLPKDLSYPELGGKNLKEGLKLKAKDP